MGGGDVNPYGQPDRKISVFYDSPYINVLILVIVFGDGGPH